MRRARDANCLQCRLGSLFGKRVFSGISAAKEVKRATARRPMSEQSAERAQEVQARARTTYVSHLSRAFHSHRPRSFQFV